MKNYIIRHNSELQMLFYINYFPHCEIKHRKKLLNEISRLGGVIAKIDMMKQKSLEVEVEFVEVVFKSRINKIHKIKHCEVPDCDGRNYGLGFCATHYSRYKWHGHPLLTKNPAARKRR